MVQLSYYPRDLVPNRAACAARGADWITLDRPQGSAFFQEVIHPLFFLSIQQMIV